MTKDKKKLFHIVETISGREWFVMARDVNEMENVIHNLCFDEEDIEFEFDSFKENVLVEVSSQLKLDSYVAHNMSDMD